MILANLRQRLTPDDHGLVLGLLARGDGHRRARLERRAAEEGPDSLLDEAELPGLLLNAPGCAAPSAPLFIYVAVRHTLRRAGLDHPRLADYVGAMVFEFGLRDRAWRVAPHDDDEFHCLADIVAAAEQHGGRRGFLLLAHLGNYSLWLAGLFPDRVARWRQRRGGPDFSYYETLGARGFRLASDDDLAARLELAEVYAHAAERFGAIRVALNRLSDEAFFRTPSPERLLRQVTDGLAFPAPDPPLF
jgi:hypothetical protein